MLESTAIRRELFKIKYQSGEYIPNFEADAFECFDFLLTCIHTWSQLASSGQKAIVPMPIPQGSDYNLATAAKISCDASQVSPCFVHNMFYLNISYYKECTCRVKTKAQSLD